MTTTTGDKDEGRGGGSEDANLSSLLVNVRGSERAAVGTGGGRGGEKAWI